jgi:hypothetical protein
MSEKPFWTPPEPEPEVESTPAEEPFLRRWSRLKSEQLQEDEVRPPAAAEEPAADEAQEPAAEVASEDDEDSLPPIEALDENSDYSAYMSPKVSQTLRKQALRKLFRSAKFNYQCPMNEYAEDYTSFPLLGDTVTADMKHAAEVLLKKQREAEEAAAAAAADATDENEEAAEAAAAVTGDGEEPGGESGGDAGETPDPATDTSEDKQRDA